MQLFDRQKVKLKTLMDRVQGILNGEYISQDVIDILKRDFYNDCFSRLRVEHYTDFFGTADWGTA